MMEFGCIFSNYDSRDYKLVAEAVMNSDLPNEFVLEQIGDVKNQKSVGSCVAHAMSTILEYHAHYYNKELSTNFIYGIQKELFDRDGRGMILRDACSIVQKYGDMLEIDCPGNDEVPECHEIASNAFNDTNKVSRAYNYHIKSYYSCNSIDDIKYALINHGPVLGALEWYKEYKVNDKGILTGNPTTYSGGHAVVIYGYNEDGFICQNSWGKMWGKKGTFIVPYDIQFREARGIVDYENVIDDDIKKPLSGFLWNFIYKIINFVVNLFSKSDK